MIKIKDSIINENQLKQIDQVDDELHIIFTSLYDDFWVKATFEDIEWNYGQSNIKEDEYIELSNKYQRLSNRNEELEEENKELVETNYNLATKKTELEDRINKATKYVKENKTKYCLGRDEFTCELKYSDELVKASEVENILKGEE